MRFDEPGVFDPEADDDEGAIVFLGSGMS